MNPERILIADAVALGRTTRYTGERVVFGWAIGQDQAIHHPLALRWIEFAAAELMTLRTAAAYDRGEEADAYANAAKYCTAETAPHLRNRGHGPWQHGYACEYPVESHFRETQTARICLVSPRLILSSTAARVLGLPRS
jgi:acyl-CoA dehydrogenase